MQSSNHAIGVVLWLISLGKIFSSELAAADILVFASLISAVDPVAVLEIFQDLNVNRTLYSLVFGESLIKDTICIVLFSIFDSIRQANNNVSDYLKLTVRWIIQEM
jgi:NhaP-type Na+/H+ or K+/H+ antiporter